MAEASCDLLKQDKAYPRTCAVCGLGPCQKEDRKHVPDLVGELRSIAKWMEAVPDHRLLGGMVLSWGDASKRVAEAANIIASTSNG